MLTASAVSPHVAQQNHNKTNRTSPAKLAGTKAACVGCTWPEPCRVGDCLACREPCVEQDGLVQAQGHTGLSQSPACPVRGSVVPLAAGLFTMSMVLLCEGALAAAFLPQKPLGASFHSSCSKITDSNVVSLGNLPRSCAQGPPGSGARERCSQPYASVQKCRCQAQPHAQEWQGGTFTTLPK